MRVGKTYFMILTLLFLCTTLLFAVPVNAATSLDIILYTTKPSYWLGDATPTYGYLEANGSTVHDGIVCLEIDTPQSNFSNSHPILFRTLPTDNFVHSPQAIEITQLYSSDLVGNRKNLTRGVLGYFDVNITNHNGTQLAYTLTVTAFDSAKGVIDSSALSTTIRANTIAYTRLPFYLPSKTPTGTAIAFANVFTKFPRNGGTQIAWEKNCTFTILDPNLPNNATGIPPNLGGSYKGQFFTNYTIPKYQPWGNYTLYASASYARTIATTQKTVLMKVPDVNNDGKVNILDLISVTQKIGWTGTPGSIPQDVNADGRVNVLDLIIVASWLGYSYP